MFGKKSKEAKVEEKKVEAAPNPIEAEEMPETKEEEKQETEQPEEITEEITDEVIRETLVNHEQRLQSLESALFRLKGAL